VTDKAFALFSHYNVLSERELQAREEVMLETYCTKVSIEARTLIQMLSTQVLPAGLRYQGELANVVAASHAVSIDCSRTSGLLSDIGKYSEGILKSLEILNDTVGLEHKDSISHALFIKDTLLPAMVKARAISDKLETLVPDDIWPLPSYTEMLFIR
jgi:glutamine synthetase